MIKIIMMIEIIGIIEIIILIIIGVCLLGIPLFFTIRNVLVLFIQRIKPRKPLDLAVFVIGLPLTFLVVLPLKPWDESLRELDDVYHSPLCIEPIIIFVMVIAVVSYLVLRVKGDHLPPLPKTILLSGLYVGCIYAVLWIIQLSENLFMEEPDFRTGGILDSDQGLNYSIIYLMLFAINYILMVVRMVVGYIKEPLTAWPQYKSPFLNRLSRILSRCGKLPVAALILLLPVCVVILGILTLFGQQQVLINAFTQTSDWYFSTKISPPVLSHTGHYLCTVAAQGNPHIVKPLRRGIRHGVPIIVNRQLCVANAFEDILSQHCPHLHNVIRSNYDRYGLPVCHYIDRPWKANIIYWVMKPAEWLFILVLYTFDTAPEQRIARQYQDTENNIPQ